MLDFRALEIPIDGPIKFLGETFRSTGRFNWPLLYIVTIGAVVLLGTRPPLIWAVPLMVVCLAAQIADSEHGLSIFSNNDPKPADHWNNDLSSPFWQRAEDAGYTRLRAIPVVYWNSGWRALEHAAYLHHLDVDAIYLGRVDRPRSTVSRTRKNGARNRRFRAQDPLRRRCRHGPPHPS